MEEIAKQEKDVDLEWSNLRHHLSRMKEFLWNRLKKVTNYFDIKHIKLYSKSSSNSFLCGVLSKYIRYLL